jgi:hypothetical protein
VNGEPFELECGWCGDVAFQSLTGVAYDGDGGSCVSCGFPGHVCVDTEHEAHWQTRDGDPLIVAEWVRNHPDLAVTLSVEECAAVEGVGVTAAKPQEDAWQRVVWESASSLAAIAHLLRQEGQALRAAEVMHVANDLGRLIGEPLPPPLRRS